MKQEKLIPEIVNAAQSESVFMAALSYMKVGFSVLPLNGKRPACPEWKQYQRKAADYQTIRKWDQSNLLNNVGIVCGKVSGKLVVLDLDGVAGYPAFAAQFPKLAETYTVATGGGVGKHIYWRVDRLPESIKAMQTPIGNLELCAEGRQIVAVPSMHPDTQKPYRVEIARSILHVPKLDEIVTWIESFKTGIPDQPPRAAHNKPDGNYKVNPDVIRALESHFLGQGHKRKGDWIHGSCINTHDHKNGDRHPSFGFHCESGYAYCYVCGTMLAKDICEAVGIDPNSYGGLIEKPQHVPTNSRSSVKIADAPGDSLSPIKGDDRPPDAPGQTPSVADLKLPSWLQRYVDWAGTTGNQTPMSFHLGAGLWLLSVAIGRRLYAKAPWGVKIFPNLYLMMIAGTTYYRKSTAYKLAEQIARQAIPHMLMPTPGSPERFQEALSGRLPANYDKLTSEQQFRLKDARPFAAQRGLLKDEIAGLFGAINRKDYMVGMKDLLMELYDCPDYSDKDTQSGLTIVENAALSILGVTTPAGLSSAVSDADWTNGLLIRFGLLTPEPDYQERPASNTYQAPPPELVADLRRLHEKLPAPEKTEDGFTSPKAMALDVQCWEECQAYGEYLRQLCNPNQSDELDERLKGVYGRMHVQAFKLAELFAALEWLDQDIQTPAVTDEHWNSAKAIAESWRVSATRLLIQIDKSGEAVQERREQDRVLKAVQRSGANGIGLRALYRNLNLSAKRARQLAHDLVRAGLIVERKYDRAEWFVAVEFAEDAPAG